MNCVVTVHVVQLEKEKTQTRFITDSYVSSEVVTRKAIEEERKKKEEGNYSSQRLFLNFPDNSTILKHSFMILETIFCFMSTATIDSRVFSGWCFALL